MKISIQMGFLSFLKYTYIIFSAHLATSCSAPFDIHCSGDISKRNSDIRTKSNSLGIAFMPHNNKHRRYLPRTGAGGIDSRV
jgi:hypothetical protein